MLMSHDVLTAGAIALNQGFVLVQSFGGSRLLRMARLVITWLQQFSMTITTSRVSL
jgi:hypothetical protein